MSRLAPLTVLVLVTTLLHFYGNFSWSWLGGPVAALALLALDRKSHEPSAPAARHRREPAPVD